MLDITGAQQFEFTASMWLWTTPKASWHFVTLPKDQSEQIKFFASDTTKRGWGSVRVEARIGGTNWKTSIFPSKEIDAYILPIKSAVRDAESMKLDTEYSIHLTLI